MITKTRITVSIIIALLLILPGCAAVDQYLGRELPVLTPPENLPEPDPKPPPAPEEPALPPPRVTLHPSTPVQGDHVVIEIGPFPEEPRVRLEAGLRGNTSLLYWHDSRVYMFLAVSYFNEAGEYPLDIEVALADGEVWEARETLTVREGDFTHQRFSVSAQTTQGWTSRQLEEDREKLRRAREETLPVPLWQGSFQWPLQGRITSDYGAMRTINNRAPTRHNGIDIAAREGTPLAAANGGVVRLAEHLLSGGNTVIIDHGMDICGAYLHLHEIRVQVGQWVEKGEIIGTVGKTGYATGPHLHWTMYVGHSPVSPYIFMETDFLFLPRVLAESLGPL